jgi:hypothetical protein
MNEQGTTRSDLILPDETDDEVLAARINDGINSGKEVFVTVLAAMGIEKVNECKESS